jgi:vacuolar-type H+-ATPase subunit H
MADTSGTAGETGAASKVETAKAVGAEAASEATSQAQQVVGQAKEEMRAVTGQAKDQARQLAGQARHELRQQADSQTERMAGGLRTFASQLQAAMQGDTQNAGSIPDMARDATSRLESLADRMETRGIDGVLDDVQRFARRRPGAFLAGAAALGFAAGRMFRGMQAAEPSGTDQQRAVPRYDTAPDTGTIAVVADGAMVVDVTDPAIETTPMPATTPVPGQTTGAAIPGRDTGMGTGTGTDMGRTR